MHATEAALIIAPAFILAIAYAFAVDGAPHNSAGWSELKLTLRTVGSAALLAMVIAPVVATLVARGSIADLLKER